MSGDFVVDAADVSARISPGRLGDLRIAIGHVESPREVVLLDRPGVPATAAGCPADDV